MNYINELVKICRERIGYRIEHNGNLFVVSKAYGYSIPVVILNENTNEVNFNGINTIQINNEKTYNSCKNYLLEQRY